MKAKLFLTILLSYSGCLLYSQVRIRLLTDLNPEYVIFTVSEGEYEIADGAGAVYPVQNDNPVAIYYINNKVFVKVRNIKGFLCDSVTFRGLTGNDIFSLRFNETGSVKRYYNGDLQCFHDLNNLLIINICEIEKYISGVVKTEGGSGKNEEYFKTQAVIARTYTFKYLNKHTIDKYNLCDGTHCQAFHGLTRDSIIIQATLHTKALVITDPDSNLIISAFHANCGGETSPSEYVWLTSQPYLKRVIDPYCLSSKNATWEKKISAAGWEEMLRKNGYADTGKDHSVFDYLLSSRATDYVTGSFVLPFQLIRKELDLRSSFFSVSAIGDSLLLSGRGYGHGVGLCQEGAMAMALKGFGFEKIIAFYYPGVLIMDIKNAVLSPPIPQSGTLEQMVTNPPSEENGEQKKGTK